MAYDTTRREGRTKRVLIVPLVLIVFLVAAAAVTILTGRERFGEAIVALIGLLFLVALVAHVPSSAATPPNPGFCAHDMWVYGPRNGAGAFVDYS